MGIILVIEDDARIQKTLRRLFEGENYKVRVLDDDRAALLENDSRRGL